MEVVYERCCGLDVHKRSVVACMVMREADGSLLKDIRSFGTMTDDLLKLSDWLTEHRVTHVAMESTGVYWKPIWNLLESAFELLLSRCSEARSCDFLAAQGNPLGKVERTLAILLSQCTTRQGRAGPQD